LSSFIKKISKALPLKPDTDASKSIDSYSFFKNKKEDLLSDAIGNHDLAAVSKWLQKGAHVN